MRRLPPLLALLVTGLLSMPARADFYVVVHKSNPVSSMTHKQVRDIFMGRTRAFPNGDLAVPLDMPRDSAERMSFYFSLTGLDAAQVNSYWARLSFAGQTAPPQPVPDAAAMQYLVSRNPNSIGYLHRPPQRGDVQVVLVLREEP